MSAVQPTELFCEAVRWAKCYQLSSVCDSSKQLKDTKVFLFVEAAHRELSSMLQSSFVKTRTELSATNSVSFVKTAHCEMSSMLPTSFVNTRTELSATNSVSSVKPRNNLSITFVCETTEWAQWDQFCLVEARRNWKRPTSVHLWSHGLSRVLPTQVVCENTKLRQCYQLCLSVKTRSNSVITNLVSFEKPPK